MTSKLDLEAQRILGVAAAFAKRETATPEASVHAQNGATVDKLYMFLDVLDRKAANMITLNSFMAALSGLFVFKPLGLFDSTVTAAGIKGLGTLGILIFAIGGTALIISLSCIAAALVIFRIRWNFLYHAEESSEGVWDLAPEVRKEAREMALRQRMIFLIWVGTLLVLFLDSAAILITVCGGL